jgi:restriction endonuclease Mrr
MSTIGQQLLAQAEVLVEGVIQQHCDALVESALTKLKATIPTQIDDMIIDAAKPLVKEAVKAELLKLANKIDGQEG